MSAADDLEPVDGCDLPSRETWIAERIPAAEWAKLHAYDRTVPTGVIVGKRWRRTDADGDWIGRYSRDLDGELECVFAPAIVLDELHFAYDPDLDDGPLPPLEVIQASRFPRLSALALELADELESIDTRIAQDETGEVAIEDDAAFETACFVALRLTLECVE